MAEIAETATQTTKTVQTGLLMDTVRNWLAHRGLSDTLALMLTRCLALTTLVVVAVVVYLLAKRLLLAGLRHVIRRTETTWDDTFLEKRVFDRLAHLAPAIVIYHLSTWALHGSERGITALQNLAVVYMIVITVLVIDSFLNAILDIYHTYEISRRIPLKILFQVVKIVVCVVAGVFILSAVMGTRSPWVFLSGLGAMTAVIMLIFKDTILGLVAGIQLTTNKMVNRGDWIEMPKYGADGDVIDITLTTVKVRNWDKTISTIPTYALISDSFRNWRGMSESGGRRIKRSLFIDMNTVKFCTEEMLARFRKIQHITEYIERKKKEIAAYNAERNVDDSTLANGRRLTNIGTFRAYVEAHLRNNPHIHQQLTFMVRQLAPTEHGLPIEIYVFSNDTAWTNYERIQADIFDHILAVVPEFDLRVFQSPAGADVRALGASRS